LRFGNPVTSQKDFDPLTRDHLSMECQIRSAARNFSGPNSMITVNLLTIGDSISRLTV